MLKLKSLQEQLESVKIVFNAALSNQDISVDELRKIRDQIIQLENLIEERKSFLSRSNSDN